MYRLWSPSQIDLSGHRVGRALSFFSSRRNWDSTNPSLAGKRGGWESPNSDEGTYTAVLCKYTYFVYQGIPNLSKRWQHCIEP